MRDFLSQEDMAAVAEWSSFNTGFAWEGSKQSVVFSETPVPPTSQPSPSWHFGACSLSSEEEEKEKEEQEEAVPSRSTSEEDLTCGEGVCVDVEKDSELSERESRPSPAALHRQPWGGEEEEEVAEDGEDSFAFRKPHGECPNPDAPNGLPELICCFQVVSPAPAPHVPATFGVGTQTLQQADATDPQRSWVCLAWTRAWS